MDKKQARTRRSVRSRAKIREIGIHRLCVHRTPQHTYAQVISPDGGKVIVAASTLEKELRGSIEGHLGNVSAAVAIGKAIAERAREKGIEQVAFDRSGFRYHGRLKALADAARESGLKF